MKAPLPDPVGVVERLLKRAPVIANPNDRKLLYACSDVIQSLAARSAELEGAVRRQTDNMSFILNRVDLHKWQDKFEQEMTEDRQLLPRQARSLLSEGERK